jgi:ABC-type antimicrobial peptide transport system permease subunit
MAATQFWLLHAGLSLIAGIIFLLAGRLFGHLLATSDTNSAATS